MLLEMVFDRQVVHFEMKLFTNVSGIVIGTFPQGFIFLQGPKSMQYDAICLVSVELMVFKVQMPKLYSRGWK